MSEDLKQEFEDFKKDMLLSFSNFKDAVWKEIKELTSKVTSGEIRQAGIEKDIKYIVNTLGELKTKIDNLVAVPSKRWDTIVVVLITAGITTAINIIINKI